MWKFASLNYNCVTWHQAICRKTCCNSHSFISLFSTFWASLSLNQFFIHQIFKKGLIQPCCIGWMVHLVIIAKLVFWIILEKVKSYFISATQEGQTGVIVSWMHSKTVGDRRHKALNEVKREWSEFAGVC